MLLGIKITSKYVDWLHVSALKLITLPTCVSIQSTWTVSIIEHEHTRLYSPAMLHMFASVNMIMNSIDLLSAPHRLKSAAADSDSTLTWGSELHWTLKNSKLSPASRLDLLSSVTEQNGTFLRIVVAQKGRLVII